MEFKEIKPGMVIHCPKIEDAEMLLKHLKELDFCWRESKNEITEDDGKYEYYYIGENSTIGWAVYDLPRKYAITEFSDLIEPEPRFKVGDKVRVRKGGQSTTMIGSITFSTTPLLENAQRAESHRTVQMLIEQNARSENDQKKEEKAEPVQDWILCSEKLPEVEVPVLIYHNFLETGYYEKITIGHLHQPEDRSRKPFWQWVACDKIYKEWISDYHRAEFICPGDEYVIAWMPLPELPRMDGNKINE